MTSQLKGNARYITRISYQNSDTTKMNPTLATHMPTRLITMGATLWPEESTAPLMISFQEKMIYRGS